MEENKRRTTGWLLMVTGGVLILGLTLWPTAGAPDQEMSFWCILCGSRALADTLLNVLLFMPFGAGIGLLRGVWWALAASTALSGSIEFAQTFLSGRFSVFDDILANSPRRPWGPPSSAPGSDSGCVSGSFPSLEIARQGARPNSLEPWRTQPSGPMFA